MVVRFIIQNCHLLRSSLGCCRTEDAIYKKRLLGGEKSFAEKRYFLAHLTCGFDASILATSFIVRYDFCHHIND